MFSSHYKAGSGAVLVETREERRLLTDLLAELPAAQVCTIAAPGGPCRDARTGKTECNGLAGGYSWACGAPGRVLVVYDWHTLANTVGHWRTLIEVLPALRYPKGAQKGDVASLVVFVGAQWELAQSNPLRGNIPIMQYSCPSRSAMRAIAEDLAAKHGAPLNGQSDAVADALCGLTAECAEQAASECLSANGMTWVPDYLRNARRQVLRESGLELRPLIPTLAGLSDLQGWVNTQLVPWSRDSQLCPRNILCAGQPGTGKTYWPSWLGSRLGGVEVIYFSLERMKAGIVGQSGANLRANMRTVDTMSRETNTVVLLDELDKLATTGLDGGASSGMYSELLYWLEYREGHSLVIASCNDYGEIAAPLARRFHQAFRFDLPSAVERQQVAAYHLGRLGCEYTPAVAESAAQVSEGFSCAEIVSGITSAARASSRKPDVDCVIAAMRGISPVSIAKPGERDKYNSAASHLPSASGSPSYSTPSVRKIAH